MNSKFFTKAYYLRKFRPYLQKFFPEMYLWEDAKNYYQNSTGKKLSYRNPQDMNEKMMWLSRYWQHPLKTKCADKFLVRDYVRDCGCGDILNELYGVYDTSSQIDYSILPNQFVLKCNHGSGFNILCPDKSKLSIEDTNKKLDEWMKVDFWKIAIETQYIEINRKIICEKYLNDPDNDKIEYQIFCLNGEPSFFLARNDLGDKGSDPYAISYTIDWHRVAYRNGEDELMDLNIHKPFNYLTMIEYAKKLSQPFPHVRVDYYEIGEKLVFGELTFSTSGNIFINYKQEVVDWMGRNLILPPKYKSDL